MNSRQTISFKSCGLRSGRECKRAFTLIEVVTLVAVAGLLVLWLVPASAHIRPGTQRAQCLNNLRQMANAFKLYADDNGGKIVSAYPSYAGFTGTWCAGNASSGGSAGSYYYGGADPAGINTGLLWPYTRDVRLYHCPTDRRIADSPSVPAQFQGKPILRSIAMNSFMAGTGLGIPSWSPNMPMSTRDPNRPIYLKESEMKNPASTFVFIDEDGQSINDAMLTVDVGGSYGFIDMPSRAHHFGYGLSYIDGSAGINQLTEEESKAWGLSSSLPRGGLHDWMVLTNVTTHPL